jgi:EmrB/QacA subfamily drug resistance transporter
VRRYLVFVVVSITMLISSVSGTAISVAFPQIVTSFNTSLIVAGWVLGVNQLSGAAGMPLMGKISDASGNKFTFVLCICLFTLGSLLCVLAPNIEALIIFRCIQGLGMAGFLPVGTSIVADQFRTARQQFIGFLSSIYAIGSIIGPNLGGWLVTAFGWESVFWIFIPFGLFILIIIILLLPKTRGNASKLDLVGAGLLTAFLTAIMFGISLMGSNQQEVSWVVVGLSFAAAAILLYVFIRRQARVEDPIIDIHILREKRFMAANAYNFFLGFGLFAISGFIPLYAVSIFNMSTFDSGFVMTPRSIGIIITSVVVSLYLVKLGYRKPMIIGTVVTAVCMVFMGIAKPDISLFGTQISGFLLLSLILLIIGLGHGTTLPAANNACIELMPEKVGTITGVRGMFRQMGGAIGISVITLVLHNSGSIQRGFFLVLVGTGIFLLLSLPLIFMMPKNACVLPVTEEPKQT